MHGLGFVCVCKSFVEISTFALFDLRLLERGRTVRYVVERPVARVSTAGVRSLKSMLISVSRVFKCPLLNRWGVGDRSDSVRFLINRR